MKLMTELRHFVAQIVNIGNITVKITDNLKSVIVIDGGDHIWKI